MSVIDNRTLVCLGGIQLPDGFGFLTTTFSTARDVLTELRLMPTIQNKIDRAEQLKVGIEFYKYVGADNNILPLINNYITEQGEVRIQKTKVRHIKDVAELVQILRTVTMNTYTLNPKNLSDKYNLIYDNPYFFLHSNLVCYFTPELTKDMMKYSRIQGNLFIYEYVSELYYLEVGYQRHLKSERIDRLIINMETGKAVADYQNVVNNRLISYKFIFDKNKYKWVKDDRYTKSVVIEGSKDGKL